MNKNLLFPEYLIKKIAVFRALRMGDFLCAVPAIRAIHNAYPDAQISYIGLSQTENLIHRFSHFISNFIPFPGYPGLPEQVFDAQKFRTYISDVRKRQFDLILQMHGNGTIVNPIIEMSGSKMTAGYIKNKSAKVFDVSLPYPETIPEVKRHNKLMKAMGIDTYSDDKEYPLTQTDRNRFQKLSEKLKLSGYICIHTGASTITRIVNHKIFIKIADMFAKNGFQVVFTGVRKDYPDVQKNIVRQMKYPALNICGRTDLGLLGVLIKNAYLVISNDTGISHIADALSVKSIILFKNSDIRRWAPLNQKIHRIIDSHNFSLQQFLHEYISMTKKPLLFTTI